MKEERRRNCKQKNIIVTEKQNMKSISSVSEDRLRSDALDKLAQYLGYREHSPKELKTKLMAKSFSESVVDWALLEAAERKWLRPSEELSQEIYLEMNKKNKGFMYINNYLKMKGLPAVLFDRAIECEKAHRLLARKFENFSNQKSEDVVKKAIRYLQNRGFKEETVGAVICENERY